MRKLLLLTFVLLLVVPMVGAQDDEIVIGYSAPGLDAFQAGVMNSVGRYATEKGWQVINQNSPRDAELQANQIEFLIALDVDAIIAVPVDSQAFCASVRRAEEAGIPISRSTVLPSAAKST